MTETNIKSTSLRCALYARVSTKDKGQETENQLRKLREFAAQSGWSIAAEYIDHESGKISDREQFQAMSDAHPSGTSTCCCSGRSTDSVAKAPCPRFSICNA